MGVNNAKTELKATEQIISGLEDYQSKNWGIGLTGDTLQPDQFLAFYTQRGLPFEFYVRGPGVSLGDSSAYGQNIDTARNHMKNVRNHERENVDKTVSQLQDYQSRNWAIGLNGDTLKPDGFLTFFAQRGLPFSMYVRSQGVSVGDSSAYDKNINTLQEYINSL